MSQAQATHRVKLVPHENGWAIPLDATLLRDLGIDESTPVSVFTDGTHLIITKAGQHATPEHVAAALRAVNKEWGGVLKKLAE